MTDNRTTELREKLTERGINYVADIASHDGVRTTHWKNDCNIVFQAIDFGMDDLLIQVALTPEQAIAATLGSDASAVRLAERLRGISDEMRSIGASSMTPHELLACYASDVDKVADSLMFAAKLGEKPRDKTEEWLLKACNQATQDYVAQLEQEVDELENKLEAATLGNECATHDTLTAEQVRKAIEKRFDFDIWVPSEHCKVVQDITDELNAELGSGTCKITATSTNNLMYPDYMTKWYELSCGHSLTLKGDEAPKWCAVCRKEVER